MRLLRYARNDGIYARNDDIEPGLERGGLFPLHNKLRDKLYIILLLDATDGFGSL